MSFTKYRSFNHFSSFSVVSMIVFYWETETLVPQFCLQECPHQSKRIATSGSIPEITQSAHRHSPTPERGIGQGI